MLNDESVLADLPHCPTDDSRLVATVVGWRCPICGIGLLRSVA